MKPKLSMCGKCGSTNLAFTMPADVVFKLIHYGLGVYKWDRIETDIAEQDKGYLVCEDCGHNSEEWIDIVMDRTGGLK